MLSLEKNRFPNCKESWRDVSALPGRWGRGWGEWAASRS